EGDLLKISLRGLKPGKKHALKIEFRTGPDGGIYRVEDGGKLLESKAAFDTYSASEGKRAESYAFVTPADTMTEMKIRFACEGKNAKSSNYFLKRNDLDTRSDPFTMTISEIR
ncbi:MAG: hypothetical protein JNM63_10615, partial [Spirochaetia bacterium]|nr:hypothetical protein [Spirochaetia bacterium]